MTLGALAIRDEVQVTAPVRSSRPARRGRSRGGAPRPEPANGVTTNYIGDASVDPRSTNAPVDPPSITQDGPTSTPEFGLNIDQTSMPAVAGDSARAAQMQRRVARSLAWMQALTGLQRLVWSEQTDPELRLDAAGRLKLAASTFRPWRPRHAALALLVADALMFTADDSLDRGGRDALRAALSALTDPIVSSETEREVTGRLLESGFSLTRPFNPAFLELLD